MNVAILIIEGDDAALELVSKLFQGQIESQWKSGDLMLKGKARSSSGVNIKVADAENPVELLNGIRVFIEQCKEKNITFAEPSLSAELSVGFSVGSSDQFVVGVEFSSEELLLLANCGITLCITAYPTSDEANAV